MRWFCFCFLFSVAKCLSFPYQTVDLLIISTELSTIQNSFVVENFSANSKETILWHSSFIVCIFNSVQCVLCFALLYIVLLTFIIILLLLSCFMLLFIRWIFFLPWTKLRNTMRKIRRKKKQKEMFTCKHSICVAHEAIKANYILFLLLSGSE